MYICICIVTESTGKVCMKILCKYTRMYVECVWMYIHMHAKHRIVV